MHTSLPLLIDEIFASGSSENKLKLLTQLTDEVIFGVLLNDTVYKTIKQQSRPKFLNIGLSLISCILARIESEPSLFEGKSKNETFSFIQSKIIKPKLMKSLIRNSAGGKKDALNDVANRIKTQISSLLIKFDMSSSDSMKILNQIFGPNGTLKFSARKNQDLLKVLSKKMDGVALTKYLDQL